MGYILGLYRDNAKQNGNYYIMVGYGETGKENGTCRDYKDHIGLI